MRPSYSACIGMLLACVAGWPVATAAAINPIGPFSGQLFEGLEGFPHDTGTGFVTTLDVFGGEVTITSASMFPTVASVISGATNGTLTTPHSGALFLDALQPSRWVLDHPATHFGGWFATNVPQAFESGPRTAQFYDAGGTLIGAVNLTVPLGSQWVWNGWHVTEGFKSVVFTGPWVFGAGLQFDDMQMGMVPEPSTYALLGAGLALLLVRLGRRRAAA